MVPMDSQTNTPDKQQNKPASVQITAAQPVVPAQPPDQSIAVQQQASPDAASGTVVVPAQTILHRFVRPEFVEQLGSWLFRLGFASIFLVNSAYAAFQPADFTDLLNANLIGKLIGHSDFLVKIVIVNDLLIGAFVVMHKYKKVVYIWAGIWLLIVAGLKMMNLIF